MKSPLHFYAVVSLCFLSACSTFDDVHYDRKANEQIKKLASTEIDFNDESPVIALSALVTIAEANKLIDIALVNNPNLQQTLLTLKMAEQQLTVTSSAQWPGVSAGLNTSKQEGMSTNYEPSINVAWTLDIWQQYANASSAQEANLMATAYGYQGARDLLAANVMQAYLGLVQYAQLITIETDRVTTLKTNEKIIIDRYRKGLIELSELDTAKSSTQSSQATIVDYQAQYQQAKRNLSLLTGLTANEVKYRVDFPTVLLPLDKLESQNLARRPDLQQAYQNIIASQYQHKVAYKALLPNLSLSASIGGSSNDLHEALFGSSAWQVLGQLSAPLFNASKLTSEVEIAKFTAEKSYWGFQEALLGAVNEVDNAIAQEQAIKERLSLIESALASAKRSENTYTERYRYGTASLIDLLQIQKQTFSLQAQVTQLTYQLLTNRITLGLALGLGV